MKHVNKILFYNQISIIIKYENDQINLKLFKNGSVQITGCKNINNIDHYLNILYKKLLELQDKKHAIILTKEYNGDSSILLDSYNYIYGFNDGKYNVIGYKNNMNVNVYTNTNIYTNVYTKTPSNTNNGNDMILIIDYDISPFNNKNDKNYKSYDNCNYEINIDCINVCINMNTTFNLYKLYQYLIDNKFICKYTPDTYSGIKFMYKINYDSDSNVNNGKCVCNNKCICTTSTFLIFQTGNVICSGFKSFQQLEKTILDFIKIMDLHLTFN